MTVRKLLTKICLLMAVMLIMCLFPAMAQADDIDYSKYVKDYTQGPVTFTDCYDVYDAQMDNYNGEKVTVTHVTIKEGGFMVANEDNIDFVFNRWYEWVITGDEHVGRTDNKFYKDESCTMLVDLAYWHITPYPSVKTGKTWSKGLKWQFELFDERVGTYWDIMVLHGGQEYYFRVCVNTKESFERTMFIKSMMDNPKPEEPSDYFETQPVDVKMLTKGQTFGAVNVTNVYDFYTSQTKDANGNDITVTVLFAKEGAKMQANCDDVEFVFYFEDTNWVESNERVIGKTNKDFHSSSRRYSLYDWGITAYPTVKGEKGYAKGLTWEFNYPEEFVKSSWHVTAKTPAGNHHYIISVQKKRTMKGVAGVTTSKIMTQPAYEQATPTNSRVIVNGVEICFDAYMINGNNYFKLRDIAQAISGTDSTFNVAWYPDFAAWSALPGGGTTYGAIELITGVDYVPVGGELSAGVPGVVTAVENFSPTFVDASQKEVLSYTIRDNNYYKLRDLGKALNFEVVWDSVNNCILINTEMPYTE